MLLKRLFKDSAIYGGADFLTKLLSFFSFPIIAAILTPAQFGLLELVFTGAALLGLIVNCGVNNAVQRFYWDADVSIDDRPRIVSTGFTIISAFGLITVLAALIILSNFLQYTSIDGADLSFYALVSALAIMVLNQCMQYILDVTRLHFAPRKFFVLALSFRVLTIAAGLAAVAVFNKGVEGLLVAQAIVLVLVLPLGLWFIKSDLSLGGVNKQWFKELVHFGYPFIFVGVAYWIFGSMDRWMLASMVSIDEVGIYSVAFRFASIVLFVSMAFGQAWSPFAIKIRTDRPGEYRNIYGNVFLILIYAMLLVGGGVAMFSGEIISLLMPNDYTASALPLLLLSFGVVLQSTQQITAIGISIEKRTYLFARLSWLAALVNLAGNWLLIPHFGATGAASSTILSYAVISLSYLYYTQKIHPIVINWSSLLGLAAIGILASFFAYILISEQLEFQMVLIKLSVSIACILGGWLLLPIKSIKRV